MKLKLSRRKIDFTSSTLGCCYVRREIGISCTVKAKKNVLADKWGLDVRVIKLNDNLIAVSEEEFSYLGLPEITINKNHEEVINENKK